MTIKEDVEIGVKQEIQRETPELVRKTIDAIPHATKGIIHGTGDFAINTLVGTMKFMMQTGLSEFGPQGFNPSIDMLYDHSEQLSEKTTDFLTNQMETALPFDQTDETYLLFRSNSDKMLTYASIALAGYSISRAAITRFPGIWKTRHIDLSKTLSGKKIISLSDKKMYKRGYHFNEHGREMGFLSQKEYEISAKQFANSHQYNTKAIMFEGRLNKRNSKIGEEIIQRVITYDKKSAIVDTKTGQVINFYKEGENRALIDLRRITKNVK